MIWKYVSRRLVQAVFTLAGVMLLTFLLFNVVAGDITASFISVKAGPEQRQAFLEKHKLDYPLIYNKESHCKFWTKEFYQTQFFHHIASTLTLSSKSFADDRTLLDIIRQRGVYSLSLTIPMLVLGWAAAMFISCFVAYYRGKWIDHVGVFLTVLGMCVPYLAYMILGQWLIFRIAPEYAFGLGHKSNIYVPIMIAVIAGLGTSVRFYRTVILNEINQDYVRTARAKGVPLGGILFKHVLKNCMLPVLTNLVMAIPFLILGSLLLENFFGIPGLGELTLSSVTTRDVPIITAVTFWTAAMYIIALLTTDVLYAVFDPRIRLK